jgi:GNAT superfamily N-acetyltransferase
MQELVSIHPLQPSYLEEVSRLLASELHADFISPWTLVHKVLLDKNFSPESTLVAKVGNRIVGFMHGISEHHPPESAELDAKHGWITLMAVDHHYQRQGIGGKLLERIIAYLKRQKVKSVWVSTYAPNYFWPGVDEAAYPAAIAFLKKHDFEIVTRPLAMEACLSNFSIPADILSWEEALASQGVRICPIKPEYVPGLLDFIEREFGSDWQRLARESVIEICKDQLSPSNMFIAIANEKCVGFCRHEGERFGPLGVTQQERGKGIGSILLFRCLEAMKAKGFSKAWMMWTNDRTAKFYAKAGFQETRRFSVMKRDL